MKRTAVLISCHKNSAQINKLIDVLAHPDIDIYLHIDKKANFSKDIISRKGVYVLDDEYRVDVKWGQISQIDATMNLLYTASEKENYNYYIFISGEDWPCKSAEEIAELGKIGQNRMFFWKSLNHGGKFNNLDKRNTIYFPLKLINRDIVSRVIKRLYVEITGGYNKTFKLFARKNSLECKFYFGSSWWGLNRETIKWILDYVEANPQFYDFYVNCSNPDESFFQTLVMLSPHADTNTDYLTYLNFMPGANSPEYITNDDLECAYKSSYYFMRKVNLEMIDTNKLRY